MKNKRLSIVLAVYNEEKNIRDCLTSVKDFAEEIVVIDGSSIDKTRDIARDLGAKVVKTSNKLMFHKNKQLALDKATNDWILQLDADERVSEKLKQEINSVINKKQEINGYYLPRKNYFLGKWLRKGGQYPDYVIRLVKRGKAHFPCRTVHEQIKVEGGVDYLKNPLTHLTNPTLSSYFEKANTYVSETALKIKSEEKSFLLKALFYLLYQPFYTFLNIFIRHKGFVDGLQGFLFALFSALHFPWALIKSLQFKKRAS